MRNMQEKHYDVIIVGAGLSGIGAAYHIQKFCPTKTYLVLEARQSIGGTWDLFRYPGVRSDSDMYTLGYSFKPWMGKKAIADGPSILEYVRSTAQENGIDKHILFDHKVRRSSWKSADSAWHLETRRSSDAVEHFTCNFLFMCSGYYNYDMGYSPDFPGAEKFQGTIVHPQKWPEKLDYANKRVVVIGSGATAMTLVPEMAKTASHVTMLQRSPTYVIAVPAVDHTAQFLLRFLPAWLCYIIIRWMNVSITMLFFVVFRAFPGLGKKYLMWETRKRCLKDYPVDIHFNPKYNPWDQRICLVPDADLFKALRSHTASIATDTIKTFTETGIQLNSGEHLDADVIVTATGLNMQIFGGMEVIVDGARVDFSKVFIYKGNMFSTIPNLILSMGYTNASWTLKCDLTCEYAARLLNHMDLHNYKKVCPMPSDPKMHTEPLLDFTSGYVQRSIKHFPKQGSKLPWRYNQNYLKDIWTFRYFPLEDGELRFE